MQWWRAGVGDNRRWPVGVRFTDMRLAGGLMPGCRGVGTSVSRRSRSVPVGLKRAGGLMLASRGVSTSTLGRWRSWRLSVGYKLAGWLMQRSRGTLASALWRWWISSVLVGPELAGRLMLFSREAFTRLLCRYLCIQLRLTDALMQRSPCQWNLFVEKMAQSL